MFIILDFTLCGNILKGPNYRVYKLGYVLSPIYLRP